MKPFLLKKFWISAILIVLVCGIGMTPVSAAGPAALKNLPANTVTASAVVVPEHQSQMSFAISAPVKEVLVKKGDTVKAGQPIMILSTPDLDLSVQEAEWSARSAEALYNRSKDPYKKVLRGGKVVYAAGYVEKRSEMEASFQAAQANLDAAKYELAQGTLLAPFDGVIVDINVQPGELAQTGHVVVTLADTAHMQIETTDLSERDVPAVQIGQTANVHIEALDVTVTGKVIKISPISETVGGDVVYPVTIELDEQPADLLWGMTATVEIQTK